MTRDVSHLLFTAGSEMLIDKSHVFYICLYPAVSLSFQFEFGMSYSVSRLEFSFIRNSFPTHFTHILRVVVVLSEA